jgi:hypothetical protein
MIEPAQKASSLVKLEKLEEILRVGKLNEDKLIKI